MITHILFGIVTLYLVTIPLSISQLDQNILVPQKWAYQVESATKFCFGESVWNPWELISYSILDSFGCRMKSGTAKWWGHIGRCVPLYNCKPFDVNTIKELFWWARVIWYPQYKVHWGLTIGDTPLNNNWRRQEVVSGTSRKHSTAHSRQSTPEKLANMVPALNSSETVWPASRDGSTKSTQQFPSSVNSQKQSTSD